VVERVIGTLMGLVHGLPGTTFSDVGRRGSYDSDRSACLSLEEFERWLAIAVAKYYHLRPHEGLDGQTPLHRWQRGLTTLAAEGATIPVPRNGMGRRLSSSCIPLQRCLERLSGVEIVQRRRRGRQGNMGSIPPAPSRAAARPGSRAARAG